MVNDADLAEKINDIKVIKTCQPCLVFSFQEVCIFHATVAVVTHSLWPDFSNFVQKSLDIFAP